MDRILLVEDSKSFGGLVTRYLGSKTQLMVDWAKSYQQAQSFLLANPGCYLAAVVDLNLPDAPNGEAVDLVLQDGIPCIVMTGELDADLKKIMWSKHIADYIIKENIDVIDYLLLLITRLQKNDNIGILVVDDSMTFRNHIAALLKTHKYQTTVCTSGKEALAALHENPSIKLVITDYNMPGMSGFELCRDIRRMHKRDKLSIIGMSGQGESDISARFIKSGANDFLSKPFNNEEFYCRVFQNIELIEQFDIIKDQANRDFLTGLYNRRYLFEAGGSMHISLKHSDLELTAAMLDIDHFKKINDTYGHDAGDMVLKHLAAMLRKHFDHIGILARLGGEEFCLLAPDLDEKSRMVFFENLRKAVQNTEIKTAGGDISFTMSIGVYHGMEDTVDEMLKKADQALYEAKQNGRNRVIHYQD